MLADIILIILIQDTGGGFVMSALRGPPESSPENITTAYTRNKTRRSKYAHEKRVTKRKNYTWLWITKN